MKVNSNMKIKNLLNIIILCLFVIGCGSNTEQIDDDIKEIISDQNSQEKKSHENAFYPLKETVEDLQYQINILKAQVQGYESSLHAPTLNSELLKLIKSPQLEHEIVMENGTIIQGKIINENTDKMIVQTQIGQLKIDKAYIKSIKDIDPLIPKISVWSFLIILNVELPYQNKLLQILKLIHLIKLNLG